MKVAVDMLEPVREPCLQVYPQHLVRMLLRPGSIEVGRRRSAMRRVTFSGGEVGLCCRHMEQWFGSSDLHFLSLSISDAALNATCDGTSGGVELRPACKLVDARVSALVAAVNAERIAGFPSGRLFLDSVEHALAAALVDGRSIRRRFVQTYRGGLTSTRLGRVVELVYARIEDELTLDELAESAGLSTAHFSQAFHKSTGESPHRFVLRQRVERAKEMLRAADLRVLDVAVACGFKTQQHFARVFRQMCGASPTEYRQEFLR